ncbi:MAG: hypothetical protein IFNCLDLE_02698 [Ignavibacteriaceae bacterium]|nr:hypothetical protein [Ignavibacteriaceae bacterium]
MKDFLKNEWIVLLIIALDIALAVATYTGGIKPTAFMQGTLWIIVGLDGFFAALLRHTDRKYRALRDELDNLHHGLVESQQELIEGQQRLLRVAARKLAEKATK